MLAMRMQTLQFVKQIDNAFKYNIFIIALTEAEDGGRCDTDCLGSAPGNYVMVTSKN